MNVSNDIRTLLRFAVGLLVFLVWLRLVGNPHVLETVIGLVIAGLAGWWVGRFFRPPPPGESST